MKNLGRVCVISFFVLGVSALGAASPGMTEVSDAGIVETAKPSPAPSTQDRPGTGEQSPSGNPLWGIPIKQLSADFFAVAPPPAAGHCRSAGRCGGPYRSETARAGSPAAVIARDDCEWR
jgi:hypothetical protein